MNSLNFVAHLNNNNIQNNQLNGRWTEEEHQLFLQGLKLYGKNWKKIEGVVKSRTGAQIRSHAQKFFSKADFKTRDISTQSYSHCHDGKYEQSYVTALTEKSFDNKTSTEQMLSQLKRTRRMIQQSEVNPLKLFSYHFFQIVKHPQQLINNNFFKHFIDLGDQPNLISQIKQQLPQSSNVKVKNGFKIIQVQSVLKMYQTNQ